MKQRDPTVSRAQDRATTRFPARNQFLLRHNIKRHVIIPGRRNVNDDLRGVVWLGSPVNMLRIDRRAQITRPSRGNPLLSVRIGKRSLSSFLIHFQLKGVL